MSSSKEKKERAQRTYLAYQEYKRVCTDFDKDFLIQHGYGENDCTRLVIPRNQHKLRELKSNYEHCAAIRTRFSEGIDDGYYDSKPEFVIGGHDERIRRMSDSAIRCGELIKIMPKVRSAPILLNIKDNRGILMFISGNETEHEITAVMKQKAREMINYDINTVPSDLESVEQELIQMKRIKLQHDEKLRKQERGKLNRLQELRLVTKCSEIGFEPIGNSLLFKDGEASESDIKYIINVVPSHGFVLLYLFTSPTIVIPDDTLTRVFFEQIQTLQESSDAQIMKQLLSIVNSFRGTLPEFTFEKDKVTKERKTVLQRIIKLCRSAIEESKENSPVAAARVDSAAKPKKEKSKPKVKQPAAAVAAVAASASEFGSDAADAADAVLDSFLHTFSTNFTEIYIINFLDYIEEMLSSDDYVSIRTDPSFPKEFELLYYKQITIDDFIRLVPTFYQTFIDLLETYKLTTDITFSNVNSILLEFIRITGTQKTSKPNKSKQNGRFGIKRKSKRRNRKNRKNRKNKSKRTRRMKSKKI